MSEHHHGPSKTRDAVSLVFSFFLSLALLLQAALVVVRVGVFSEDVFLSVMDNEYYEYTLKYINDQARYYTLPTGIDPAVLQDVFAVSNVRYDVNRYVSDAFQGREYTPDTTEMREALTANVNASFEKDGVTLSDETDQITAAYVDDIMQIYNEATRLPGLNSIASVRARVMRYTLVGMIALAVLSVVLVVLIMRLHFFVHRGLRYVAYATGGAALMSFVVPFALYMSGFYKGLNLAPQYFYHFGVSMVAHVLRMCLFAALVLAVITAILIAVVMRLRRSMVSRKLIRD